MGAAPKYLMSLQHRASPKRSGIALRTPFNHVFSGMIVIIDEERFRTAHSDYAKLKRGDVLTIDSMRVEEEVKYSKKKKRNIRKMALMLECRQLMNTSIPGKVRRRRDRPEDWVVDVKWNTSVFAQAKWKVPLQ